jgi:hypothetical protein
MSAVRRSHLELSGGLAGDPTCDSCGIRGRCRLGQAVFEQATALASISRKGQDEPAVRPIPFASVGVEKGPWRLPDTERDSGNAP